MILSPRFVEYGLDNIKNDQSTRVLGMCAAGIVGAALLRGVFLFLTRRWIIYASRHIEQDMRNDLFTHLLALSPSFYHENPTGDLMAVATNDLSAIRQMYGPGIMYSVSTFISGVFIIINMLLISPFLSLVALCVIPLMAITVYKFGSAIHSRFEKIQDQFGVVTSRTQENLAGIRVVRSYVREDNEKKLFERANWEYMDRNKTYVAIQSAFRPAITAVMGIGVILMLRIGGEMVIKKSLTFGEFTAFSIYMTLLIWPAVAIGWVTGLFQRGAASMKRLQKVLDTKPIIIDSTEAKTLINGDTRIEIKDLTFRYSPDGPDVLKGINTVIEPGKTTAIIGPTGAGKTTLVNLLARLYPVAKNKIYLNGLDINNIKIKSLRELFGFVPQEAFLFSDKLENNIAFAVPDATEEDIVNAAKMSLIDDEIRAFPDQFKTMLGEKGINLSGGQKQRTALARAYLKDPKILILDDALASVDTKTEEGILENLKAYSKGRTVIMIAHRISTTRHADRILVMNEGTIIEEGTHFDLIEKGGVYADLNEQQRLKNEIEVL